MDKHYDCILRGGRVIDPAQKLDGNFDVAVHGGRVAKIATNIPTAEARETIDVSGKLVVPGLIDTHVHAFRHIAGALGMDADWVGVGSGVTTLIDQGSAGVGTLPGYLNYVVENKANRIFVFLASYLVGAAGGFIKDHFTLDTIAPKQMAHAFAAHPNVLKGIKFWAEQNLFDKFGVELVRRIRDVADEVKVPIYWHIGSLWPVPDEVQKSFPPEKVLESIYPYLRSGDIFAHPYTFQPGGYFDANGIVRPMVKDALANGVKVDLGYGTSTSIKLMRAGLDQGFVVDTLGADIHGFNTAHPDPTANPKMVGMFNSYPSVTNGMNLLMACGMTLEQVIPMATSNPARIFLRMPNEIGTLKPGVVADVTVLHDERGKWIMKDNRGDQIEAQRMVRPYFCLRAGRRFDANAPILSPAAWPAAA